MGIRRLGRPDDVFLAFCNIAVGDIVADGIVEQYRLLGDDADLLAERFHRNVPYIDPVDHHPAFLNVIETRYEVNQRGFAPAAHSHKGDQLAGPDFQVDSLQDRGIFVCECNVPKFDFSRNPGQGNGVFPVADFRHRAHDIEHPLGPGDALLDRIIHVREPFYRLIKQQERREEGEKRPRSGCAVDDLVPAVEDDRRDPESAEELHQRARDGPDGNRLHEQFKQALVFERESVVLVPLHAERLDDPVSRYSLVEERDQAAHRHLGVRRNTPHFSPELRDGINRQGEYDHGDEGEFPVPVKDDENKADQGEGIFQQAGDRFGYRALDQAYVARDPGDKRSGRVFCKKGKGLVLDMTVKIEAQIGNDALADVAHQDGLAVICRPFQKINNDDGNGHPCEGIRIAVQEDLIQGRLDQEGGGGSGRSHDQHAEHGQDELAGMRKG